MITKIDSAIDAMAALSENHSMMVQGKRKPDFAREVTNNIGKMINLAKTQVIEKIRIGDKEPLKWLMEIEPKKLN